MIEKQLEQSEARFRYMADNAPVMVWTSGTDKLCTWVNKPWLDFVGRQMEQELGNGWTENVHSQDFSHCLEVYTSSFDARQSFTMDYRLRRWDGEYRWIQNTGVPLFDESGAFTGYMGSCIDITERKLAEAELQTERNFVSSVLDAVGAVVVVLDPRGIIVLFNRTASNFSGYSSEEAVGKHVWDFLLAPEDVEPVKEIFWHSVTRKLPSQSENHWITKSGERRLISWSNTILQDEKENLTQVVRTGIDITELRKARDSVSESEERFRLLAEATKIVPWEARVGSCDFSYVGPRAAELLGYPVEQWYEEGFWPAHIHPDDRDAALAFCVEAAVSLLDFEFEYRMLTADGRVVWVRDVVHVQRVNGTPSVLRGFLIDITSRKETELMLRSVREELQELSGRLLNAREEETRKLARELHDNFGQKMALLNLRASEVERLLPIQPNLAAENLRACREQIITVGQELQELSRLLHPSILHDLGLDLALRSECAAYTKRTGIVIRYDSRDVPAGLPEDVRVCLYRIAQESLQNIWKHAESKHVEVSVKASKGTIELIVRDFGKGFDVESTKGKAGLGLISMQERARLVGGSLTLTAVAGEGTRVHVRIPLREAGGLTFERAGR
jgi:PAS domain S-box-containing protein